MGVLWVKETDELIVGPRFGFVIQQGKPGGCQSFHLGMDIGYIKGDMVHSFPLFFDKAGDDAVRGLSLQQLDLCLPFLKKGGGDLLAVHFFGLIAMSIEQLLEEGNGGVEVPDGDTDVLDFLHGEVFSKIRRTLHFITG